MGGSNQGPKSQVVHHDDNQLKKDRKVKRVSQQKPQADQVITELKQQTTYTLPQALQNRQKVRECINKYNDKIELQMKKPYVMQFMSMRQKLLKNMEIICKQDYPVVKGKSGNELKQCMQSVQSLISEEDERMQQEFGMKLFLLADKCLIKEIKAEQKDKESKKEGAKVVSVDKCVDKLVKYRNLNMEMHILKLQLARELL